MPDHRTKTREATLVAETPQGWRRMLLRLGHVPAVALITLISVAISLLVTVLVYLWLGKQWTLGINLLIGTLVPMIVAPVVSHFLVGLVFEVEQARTEIHRVAIRDGLTHLYNRRFFLSRLDSEIVRARRTGQPLSLLLVDVDHFKSINDSFGHAAGDEVLERMAAQLIDAMRPYDLVARYGGEEFVALMPGADLAQAEAAAERIRKAVATMPVGFSSIGTAVASQVTASVGLTTLGGPGDGQAELLARADQAMYAAKEGGRNRCFSRPPTPVALAS
jgi:diguanylate cyclase (GGDEF)-like protein